MSFFLADAQRLGGFAQCRHGTVGTCDGIVQNRQMCDSSRSDWRASGGESRRADVAKEAERISPHRFGALRGRGFSAENLDRSTKLQI